MCSEFYRQMQFEFEGACAAFQGKTRDDCPYERESQSTEWNFWVYGCDRASEEMRIMNDGKIKICELDIAAQMKEPREYKIAREWTETTEEAYRNGNWQPRYVVVPPEWRKAA